MNEAPPIPSADLLLKGVRILWPDSEWDGQSKDISLKNGVVERIGEGLEEESGQQRIEAEGLMLSPGWTDLQANFREPGHEDKEDLASGMKAAMQGGYTRVLLMPSTEPPIDHRGGVENIQARTRGNPLSVHPAGCLSRAREGGDIAELFDMWQAGALAFTDDRRPVADAGLLTNALWYSKTFGAPILSFPDDPTISRRGLVHEGPLSTRLGMKGIPGMSEEVAVQRDLRLLEYTDAQLHFSTISSKEGLERIRQAKKEGLNVSCDVSAHHLYFDEEKLNSYSSLFKFMPPLRDEESVLALREGVMDGTVDHISSLHEPQAEEDKQVEFEIAGNGAPGLETCFGAARKALKEMSLEKLIPCFAQKPREILGLPLPMLREGEGLEGTLFIPDREWRFDEEKMHSKAWKSPYHGETLLGKPFGTVHNGLYYRSVE